jgi:hypothetical protein
VTRSHASGDGALAASERRTIPNDQCESPGTPDHAPR